MAKDTLPPAQGSARTAYKASVLFDEIASIAHRLDRECYHAPDEEDCDAEQAALFVTRLREAICRIGLIADMGSGLLGGHGPMRGGVDAWLLPPVYQMSDVDLRT